MEVSSGLLVAMMFITILSIGIGNILSSLPPLLDRRVHLPIERIHLSWILLLLLLHLSLFWQVLLILEVERWSFAEFLFTVAGPVTLLMATSILLPDPTNPPEDPLADYMAASRITFSLLALLMAWAVSMDLIFGPGFDAESVGNAVAFVFFGVLAGSSQASVHRIGAFAGWVLFGGVLVLRSLYSSST